MQRFLFLAYGAGAYALFFATFLYLIGFTTDLLVPRSVAAGGAPTAPSLAIWIDIALIALFGVQHSIMARPWFKRAWTRVVPPAIERSTFVLITCAIFALMFWQWRPLPALVWDAGDGALAVALRGLALGGFGIVLLASFAIDHFDLFGLRQVWLHFRRRPYTEKQFAERNLYRSVRHPLMLGFLIAMWAAPQMTLGQLVFAGSYTLYILIALQLEERDLLAAHGESYARYRTRVPMLLPRFWGRGPVSPGRDLARTGA